MTDQTTTLTDIADWMQAWAEQFRTGGSITADEVESLVYDLEMNTKLLRKRDVVKTAAK